MGPQRGRLGLCGQESRHYFAVPSIAHAIPRRPSPRPRRKRGQHVTTTPRRHPHWARPPASRSPPLRDVRRLE
eukprot:9245903-Prorocentrum_lima.AAC.1